MTDELRGKAVTLAEHLSGMSGVLVRVLDCDRNSVDGDAAFCTACGHCAGHIPAFLPHPCFFDFVRHSHKFFVIEVVIIEIVNEIPILV